MRLVEAVIAGVLFAVIIQGYVYLTRPEKFSLFWLVVRGVGFAVLYGPALIAIDLFLGTDDSTY